MSKEWSRFKINVSKVDELLLNFDFAERRRYTSARTSIWFFLLHDSSGAYIVLFPKNTIIAWDNSLSWLWENAMSALQETLYKVSSSIVKFPKQAPPALIISSHNIPSKLDWNLAVNKALQMIERNDSSLSKVVLERSTRVVPTAIIDPLTCLKVTMLAYQFFLQPPNAPAFIGNTVTAMIHFTEKAYISRDALAATRARGVSLELDHQIELDLLTSLKDDIEFTSDHRTKIRGSLQKSYNRFNENGQKTTEDPTFICSNNWPYLITNFSDFQLACLGSFFLHESVFFLSGLPFVWIERAGWLSKYKIQAKNNSPAAKDRCIGRLLLYHFGVNLPVMIFSYPVFKYMGMRSSLPLPSWNIILTQIMFYFILEDFIFYWGHRRILHTKWLYKHVHSVHHEYATPFGLTSEYAHLAKILFLGFATIFGPAITGPHLITLWLWMVLRVLEIVEAHSGYHFPWSPSNFFPLYGGADFHDYHHRLLYTKSGNYSSTFTYMDRIFGTDVGYRKLKALKNSEFEDSYEQKKQ
ncbi:sterol 4-alpha-methyl-oxidase 2-2 [Trifolium repens]|nr:sterol 4-alpha-methyl-oxidase 2-2 [Trifolium repens]